MNLPLVEVLPDDVSVRAFEEFLSTPDCGSLLEDVVALVLVDATEDEFGAARATFLALTAMHFEGAVGDESSRLAFDLTLGAVRSRIEALELDSQAAIQSLRSAAVQSTLRRSAASITHRASVAAQFVDLAARIRLAQWERDYKVQVASQHGYLTPPDPEVRRKVPFDELYVAPRLHVDGPAATSIDKAPIAVDDFARSLQRTVVLGDPGAGKSTVASYIAHREAELGDRVPFLVVVREFAATMPVPHSVAEYINRAAGSRYQATPPDGAVEYLLRSGRALVIFDGLDELIETSSRREVAEIVEAFANAFPQARILVTSRRVGYAQARLDPRLFDSLAIAGFHPEDVSEYAVKWFRVVAGADRSLEDPDVQAAAFVRDAEAVADLAATPLMLSLLCILYRGEGYLPRARPEVYAACANLLFKKWDHSRKIHVELDAAPHIDNAIKHIAYWMYTSVGEEAVLERDLVLQTSEYLTPFFSSVEAAHVAAQQFVDFCRGRAWVLSEAGTDQDGRALYRFTHRTFLEYFAAFEITRRFGESEQLARLILPRVSRGEWDEVAQLAIQIHDGNRLNGAEAVIRRLISDRRRRSSDKADLVSAFAWRVLSTVSVSRELLVALVDHSYATSMLVAQEFGRTGILTNLVPSILLAPDVRTDLATVVAEAVFDRCSASLEDRDDETRRVAAHLALVFGDTWGPIYSERQRLRARLIDRKREFLDSHREILLGGNNADEVWALALIAGVASIAEVIAAARSDGAPPFQYLFRRVDLAIGGIGFGSAAQNMLAHVTRNVPSTPEEMGARVKDAVGTDLEELAASCGELADLPLARTSRTLDRHLWYMGQASSALPLTLDPGQRWGAILLLLCLAELGELLPEGSAYLPRGAQGNILRLAVSTRQGRLQQDELWAAVGAESIGANEQGLLRAWCSGELALCDASPID
ncbi:NACHT domain-containing NTPase [Demequina sp. NBRC 110052]|uniref:NACHT domain-containing protein n=1 Tax=Demequina sp. NBRC 110052 TaxID=1570341 RepID=UPI00135670D7|nr:NACHT domain-containing protein [Demequina sp. NBRC 110052]